MWNICVVLEEYNILSIDELSALLDQTSIGKWLKVLNSVEAEKWGLGTFGLDVTAILHFWYDVRLVEIKHGRRTQDLSGVVQRANYFYSLFSDGLYMQVLIEFSCKLVLVSVPGNEPHWKYNVSLNKTPVLLYEDQMLLAWLWWCQILPASTSPIDLCEHY